MTIPGGGKKLKATKARKRTGMDATDRLLRAVGVWLQSSGGRAVISGPIQIITYPDEVSRIKGLECFTVGIKVFGNKPLTPAGRELTQREGK